MHDPTRPPGYRLDKLEVYNWGTFDGVVHTLSPRGATALLIGENGSGKTTLVDAILTLLARPQVRNYNVAAGAQKQERDERSYIRGAYDRKSRDEDNRAEIQYLRPGSGFFSVLLATFKKVPHAAFTVALLLHLDGEGAPRKIYCLADGEKSIAGDCQGFTGTDRVRQDLQRRGFRTTDKYIEYHSWLAKRLQLREKAMDVFNQTVAVKDVQSLNRFIREHMLEAPRVNERLQNLHTHFTQLTQAHEALVRVRRQFELLSPIASKGAAYTERAGALRIAEALLRASTPYFLSKTVSLLEPAIARCEREWGSVCTRKTAFENELDDCLDEERRVTNDIENAGGARLREIPLRIKTHEAERKARFNLCESFRGALSRAGLNMNPLDEPAFQALGKSLPGELATLNRALKDVQTDRDQMVVEQAEAKKNLAEQKRELEALLTRPTKLPESHAAMRRLLCEDLGCKEAELPFVAELIAVRAEEREWEASIEMVLRSFALSLLVPDGFYHRVSAYVNKTRLRDTYGRGQRLVYLRVGARGAVARPVVLPHSLLKKVHFHPSNPLVPWVRGELEQRFNFHCCSTIEEFQAEDGLALTRERHVKRGSVRHEKDDRDFVADPRNYVLGWDNREKRRYLQDEVNRLVELVSDFDGKLSQRAGALAALEAKKAALDELARFTSFAALDYGTVDEEIARLKAEKEKLEDADNAIRALKVRQGQLAKTAARLKAARDEALLEEKRLADAIVTSRRDRDNAERVLGELRKAGALDEHATLFEKLDQKLTDAPLTADNLSSRQALFKQSQQKEIDALRDELRPLEIDLHRLMGQYLKAFPEDQSDLVPDVQYLKAFCALCEQIRQDDLPRHEGRFKEHLNQKVLHEISLLNGAFQNEKADIEQKIEILNQSLGQLEYRDGTHMCLEPRPVHDQEIHDFQASLRECLAGSFEGTPEANEACFLSIKKVLTRLNEDERWRLKVTDIRRWFDFAVREVHTTTGEERSYYENSDGQSGGEKAKLAFTILVAAIAYQYDIDPNDSHDNRFRFVVVDEMFSRADDKHSEFALKLFRKFGLQLLIVAPLDAKARVTEPYVACYFHVVKDKTSRSELFTMTAREFEERILQKQPMPPSSGNVTEQPAHTRQAVLGTVS